jgi:hypothetical protein
MNFQGFLPSLEASFWKGSNWSRIWFLFKILNSGWAHSSASSLLSSGTCRCRALLRCCLTPILPHRLCRFATWSPHHPSTRVLRPREAKSWPSSHATLLVAAPRSLPRPLPRAIHATAHARKRTSTHSSVSHLLIPSPTCHCVLLLHTHARAFAFLCRHCRRAHLVVALPLCTIGAAAKGLNGSTLAPRCFPAQHCHRTRSEPAAF